MMRRLDSMMRRLDSRCHQERSEGSAVALRSVGVLISLLAFPMLFLVLPVRARAQHFDGQRAYDYAREFVAIGPRWPTGPGHIKAQAFLRQHLQHDNLEEDAFLADTPIGPVNLRNFIVRFPGKKDGVIVLGTHYETNYPLRNIAFVGANDGG